MCVCVINLIKNPELIQAPVFSVFPQRARAHGPSEGPSEGLTPRASSCFAQPRPRLQVRDARYQTHRSVGAHRPRRDGAQPAWARRKRHRLGPSPAATGGEGEAGLLGDRLPREREKEKGTKRGKAPSCLRTARVDVPLPTQRLWGLRELVIAAFFIRVFVTCC